MFLTLFSSPQVLTLTLQKTEVKMSVNQK